MLYNRYNQYIIMSSLMLSQETMKFTYLLPYLTIRNKTVIIIFLNLNIIKSSVVARRLITHKY